MSGGREYRFWIRGAYTRDTLPMARLAEYMADLANILGESTHVHFVRLDPGSVGLVHAVDDSVMAAVRDRLMRVHAGTAPLEAMAAYRNINRRLLYDNGIGVLEDDAGAEIIEFPGRDAAQPLDFGAFNQVGSLDGRIIAIGGKDETVPVRLQAADRIYSACRATRGVAKELAKYLFDYELRLYGEGRWQRTETGDWNLLRFSVTNFDVLKDEPLSAVVARLRDIPDNEWVGIENLWDVLRDIREGSESD
jgi:hypothetical protein